MSTTPNVPYRLEFSVEVPGTPEQVWQAIATAKGMSAWFLPTEMEEREGGSLHFTMGPEMGSDGQVTDKDTAWDENNGLGSSNGEEWAYFRDSAVNKFMYFVHDDKDNLHDKYARLGNMTVFGFGRDDTVSDPNREKMTAQNNHFTFGLLDGGSSFSQTAQTINGEYRPVTVNTGAAQKLS